MIINRTIAAAALLSVAYACAPQAELVKTRSDMTGLRDDVNATKQRTQEIQKRIDKDLPALQKQLDSLDANLKGTVDVQKVMADYGAKSDQLLTDIQLLQGKLEENNYRIAELAQKVDDRGVKIAELTARIEALEGKLKQAGAAGTASGQTGSAPDKQAAPKTIEPSDAYRQAKTDYDKGNFDLALAGFQNYITQFPEASQAAMAQYWIGECFYSKGDFKKAIDAFAKVIKTYPRSDKVAGAKLKIGLSYLSEKNSVKAKEYFHKVVKEHPGSAEADIARGRLTKMGK